MIPEMGILGSFVAGLGTGLKANVNGAAGAAASMATLGFVDQMEVWGVTDWDRSVGYDTAVGFAQAGYTILGGVATGGLACGGGKIAQAAKIYDLAGNIVGVGRGSADIYEDGLNFQNGVQVLGSSLGIAGNALSKCFTAGTQIVVGMEFDENDVFVQYVTVNIEDVR
ncbi:MAG: hypothetical protein FWD31_14195, partial [Planctomycetaceae bacterium]|nr:hypothetical protein [Planctomycetaceae bacterium]